MKLLTLILVTALMGTGVSVASEPTPTETMIQLQKLLELKQWSDHSDALVESKEWSDHGKALVVNRIRMDGAETMMYNADFSHKQSVVITKQTFLSDWVPVYYIGDIKKVNRYSPMGFQSMYRDSELTDMWEALETGDTDTIDYFKKRYEKQASIVRRRKSLLNK